MALQESNDIVFMYVFDAKICERINYPTNKSITRKIEKISDTGVKTYQDIHERHYGFIEGMLIDIQLKTFENQNEKIWNFWLQDGLEKYCLKLRYSSRESKRLLSYLPNADLNHFIRIQVFREKDSTGTALLVKQRDKYLKSAFTRETPNGLPQMVYPKWLKPSTVKAKRFGMTKNRCSSLRSWSATPSTLHFTDYTVSPHA